MESTVSKKFCLMFFIVLATAASCLAQIKPADFEKKIPEFMDLGEVPGLSVALIENSKIVWSHGFGVKNSTTKEPVNEHTVFEAASLTKPVVAYAALKLVDQGKLDLDVPLAKYLSAPYIDDKQLGQITARHVLSHTTGFPNWRPNGKPLIVEFPPGKRFSYSGEGFVYLGMVMERLTGMLLDRVVARETLEPLGMKESSLVWEDRFNTQAATGHNAAGDPASQGKPLTANAAASLHTTASDYARFMIAVMNGTGLKPATAKAMITSQVSVEEPCTNCTDHTLKQPSQTISWGLGVGLQHTEDGDSFWHWGDNGAFRCVMVGYPKSKKGIIVFTNSNNGLSIAPQIAALAMHEPLPLIAWLKYPAYDSLANAMYRTAQKDGFAATIRQYRANPGATDESQMNSLGYRFLQRKKMKEAIEIFKLNVEANPQSWNVYDSLGEAYMENGDKDLAIKNYERSIDLNPSNSNGTEMLKKIREKLASPAANN